MPVTAWERRRDMSNLVRAVWDAKREDDPASWAAAFESARESVAARLERDVEIVRELSWDEFARLQAVPKAAETPVEGGA